MRSKSPVITSYSIHYTKLYEWSGITVNYSSWSGVAAMMLVIIVVLVSVLYPSKVAGEIAIPDVNRAWTLPKANGNILEVTLSYNFV